MHLICALDEEYPFSQEEKRPSLYIKERLEWESSIAEHTVHGTMCFSN